MYEIRPKWYGLFRSVFINYLLHAIKFTRTNPHFEKFKIWKVASDAPIVPIHPPESK